MSYLCIICIREISAFWPILLKLGIIAEAMKYLSTSTWCPIFIIFFCYFCLCLNKKKIIIESFFYPFRINDGKCANNEKNKKSSWGKKYRYQLNRDLNIFSQNILAIAAFKSMKITHEIKLKVTQKIFITRVR